MPLIKFTNCCYYRGGGVTPRRKRKFQNVILPVSQEFYDNPEKYFNWNTVWYLSKGKITSTSTTKPIKIKQNELFLR